MPHITTHGIHIYYETFGSGEPLLLLMGLGGSGAGWQDHVAVYRQNFRCSVPDNRGTGQSDSPAGPWALVDRLPGAINTMTAGGSPSSVMH